MKDQPPRIAWIPQSALADPIKLAKAKERLDASYDAEAAWYADFFARQAKVDGNGQR